jgi:hypothetical protein
MCGVTKVVVCPNCRRTNLNYTKITGKDATLGISLLLFIFALPPPRLALPCLHHLSTCLDFIEYFLKPSDLRNLASCTEYTEENK